MDDSTNTLHMFQKNVDKDSDVKKAFVNSEKNNSNSDDSDSDYDNDTCKIVIPKRKKHNDTSQELLFQLMNQNQVLAKTQKKMYQLKAEMNKEEVTSRYIKLDLNTAQVKLSETQAKLKIAKNQLLHSRIENWSLRAIAVAYILFHIYCSVYTIFFTA